MFVPKNYMENQACKIFYGYLIQPKEENILGFISDRQLCMGAWVRNANAQWTTNALTIVICWATSNCILMNGIHLIIKKEIYEPKMINQESGSKTFCLQKIRQLNFLCKIKRWTLGYLYPEWIRMSNQLVPDETLNETKLQILTLTFKLILEFV